MLNLKISTNCNKKENQRMNPNQRLLTQMFVISHKQIMKQTSLPLHSPLVK